jgi:hypothetical protein
MNEGEPKKLVLLEAWAERYFDPPPSLWTLRTMARTGRFRPEAVKVGKAYYVDPDAVVIDPNRRQTLVERMQQA